MHDFTLNDVAKKKETRCYVLLLVADSTLSVGTKYMAINPMGADSRQQRRIGLRLDDHRATPPKGSLARLFIDHGGWSTRRYNSFALVGLKSTPRGKKTKQALFLTPYTYTQATITQ